MKLLPLSDCFLKILVRRDKFLFSIHVVLVVCSDISSVLMFLSLELGSFPDNEKELEWLYRFLWQKQYGQGIFKS